MRTNKTRANLIIITLLLASESIAIEQNTKELNNLFPVSYALESSLAHGFNLSTQHLMTNKTNSIQLKIRPSFGFFHNENQFIPSKYGIEANIQFKKYSAIEFGLGLSKPFYTTKTIASLSASTFRTLPFTKNWDIYFRAEGYHFINANKTNFGDPFPWNPSLSIGIQLTVPKPQEIQ